MSEITQAQRTSPAEAVPQTLTEERWRRNTCPVQGVVLAADRRLKFGIVGAAVSWVSCVPASHERNEARERISAWENLM